MPYKFSAYLAGNTFSATKTICSILFGKIVAIYCENPTEHTDALCGQNAKF
jgi:hypothetical protein